MLVAQVYTRALWAEAGVQRGTKHPLHASFWGLVQLCGQLLAFTCILQAERLPFLFSVAGPAYYAGLAGAASHLAWQVIVGRAGQLTKLKAAACCWASGSAAGSAASLGPPACCCNCEFAVWALSMWRAPMLLRCLHSHSLSPLACAIRSAHPGLPPDCSCLACNLPLAKLLLQISTVDLDDPQDCAAKFASNTWYGALLFAGILADRVALL